MCLLVVAANMALSALTSYGILFIAMIFMAYLVREHFMPISTRSICPTRNMSTDLRGEAYYPPRVLYPFIGSGIGPLDPRMCS